MIGSLHEMALAPLARLSIAPEPVSVEPVSQFPEYLTEVYWNGLHPVLPTSMVHRHTEELRALGATW